MSSKKMNVSRIGILGAIFWSGLVCLSVESFAGRSYIHPPQLFFQRMRAYGNGSPLTSLNLPNNENYNAVCRTPTDPTGSLWPIPAGPLGGISLTYPDPMPTLKQCGLGWNGEANQFGSYGQLVLTNTSTVPQPVSIKIKNLGPAFIPEISLLVANPTSNFGSITWKASLLIICVSAPGAGTLPIVSKIASKSVPGTPNPITTAGETFGANENAVWNHTIAANESLGCLIGQTFQPDGAQELTGSGLNEVEAVGGYVVSVDVGTNLGGIVGRINTYFDTSSKIVVDPNSFSKAKTTEFLNGGRPF